ncbi:MAG: MerR family transcriptional regulator [Turicibacter sp.]
MEARFSIGEMAKIHHVSVQTLRHYDKVGILKPAYINEESGYRYYSVKSFVILDLIKRCKAMGLSLDEIKIMIANYTSFDSILDIMSKQTEMIDLKIKELENIKNNISFLEQRIKETLDKGINTIFIEYNEERKFSKYDNVKRYTEDFEIRLTKTLLKQHQQDSFNKELAFAISYHDLKTKDELIYNNMLMSFTETTAFQETNTISVPAGHYLTLNFDDDYNDTKAYYDKVLHYIEENNIIVTGEFYEIYIMTRVGSDGKEMSLGKIQILIQE